MMAERERMGTEVDDDDGNGNGHRERCRQGPAALVYPEIRIPSRREKCYTIEGVSVFHETYHKKSA